MSATLAKIIADISLLWDWFGSDDIYPCESCGAFLTPDERAAVADIILCPREGYHDERRPYRYASEPCFRDRPWRRLGLSKFTAEEVLKEITPDIARELDSSAALPQPPSDPPPTR